MASLRNKKAQAWLKGRKNLFNELQGKLTPGDRVIWMHCASAGELEQGKPLLEALKESYASHKILVSLFSPSGFAAAKKSGAIDLVTYLPADTRANAEKFVALVKPELVIFIKYEYWYHHLSAVASKKIPLLLVAAIFRKEQVFFKWYGKFYRDMLSLYKMIFVQDEDSCQRLAGIKISNCMVSGDTRFDRVKKIADNFSELPLIQNFVGSSEQVVVAGSTWPEDEKLLAGYVNRKKTRLILAPHEITEAHLKLAEKLFPDSMRYSTFEKNTGRKPQVLLIDNYGMLSRLYYYATVVYIGGGFNKSGIHNTLEAAVFGKVILFGPNYQKFKEARDLVSFGGAWSVTNSEKLERELNSAFYHVPFREGCEAAVRKYMEMNTGATQQIIRFIQENRLLTS